MKRRMKPSIILLLCCSIMAMRQSAMAQSGNGLEQVMAEMKKMQSFYTAHPLSFGIKYTYSNEHTPEKVLDSLSGKIEMSGTSYRCWLDSTETIRNERYNITLFKEDKIIYLAKPAIALSAADPLQLIQATLEKTGINRCEIVRSGHNKIVRILFGEGKPYRQMEMTIDTLSGHLLAMRYIVKTALLMEAPDNKEAAAQGYDEYAIVRASFNQYRQLPANPARFDEHTFFYKEGNVFKTTKAYQDYKIIVGTPNL